MDMSNQFLSLSLFIMMLSFFIILSTVSDFEQNKSQPVINSISTAFSNKEIEEKLLPNTVEAPEEAASEGDALDKLDKLFNTTITGAQITRNRLGTVMHVRIPVAEFEKAVNIPPAATLQGGAPILQNTDNSFMPTLASLIQTKSSEVTYRMDMVLNIDKPAAIKAKDDPQNLKKDIQKVTGFAEKLEAAGVPVKLVSAGVVQGDPLMIDIYFKRYQPFNPMGLESANETENEAGPETGAEQ